MNVKKLLISAVTLNYIFLAFIAKAPNNTQAANNQAGITPVGQGSGWSMTFNDDFNGSSLNRNVWRSDYFPNGGNGEMQQYVSDNSHNNYIVQKGMLQIVGRKETLNGQPYTSGIIHTKGRFEQKYGYFEIRAQVPYGKGYWPAFWLLPDQDNWVPEIDVTEILGDKPATSYMTLHYNNSSGAYLQYQGVYTGANFSAGWHTFAIDWEPAYLIYYVDGVERYRVTDAAAIPNMPLYMIANLAVGGNWPGAPDASTVFPGYYNIDYIRAWQRTSAVTPTPVHATATPAPTKVPAGTNIIANPSFETAGASPWYTPWAFRNDLGAVFSQDTSTAANGTLASLKVYLPSSNSAQPWVVAVNQTNKAFTRSQSYTLSFMAKASAPREIRAVVQLQDSPYTELTNQAVALTTGWTRYTLNFTPTTSTTAAMLNFNLAGAAGNVWLDDVSLCETGYVCK